MKIVIALSLLLSSAGTFASAANSAQTQSKIVYVKLIDFATQNSITMGEDGGNFRLIKGRISIYLTANSAVMLINDKPVQMSAKMVGGVAPLIDLQKAFGLVSNPSSSPTAQKSPANIAPSGYFRSGSIELPKARVITDDFDVTPANVPQRDLSILDKYGINMRLSIDGIPLPPEDIGRMCQYYVRKSLKSPASSQFIKAKVYVYTNKFWTIDGEFDAQNSYGALLRGEYYCVMRVNGNNIEGYFFTTK